MKEQATQELATVHVEEEQRLPTKVVVDQTIQRGQYMAKKLADIIEERNLYTMIGPSKHIRVEGWQTVGALAGFIGRTREIPNDGDGVMAIAEIVRMSTGEIISTATHECGSKGDGNWAAKPRHQQASMAQTRALSKAFRNVLSWIVVLAGYEPTPSEEMNPARMTGDRADEDNYGACPVHHVPFFKKGKMKRPAHNIEGTNAWCNKGEVELDDKPTETVSTVLAGTTVPQNAGELMDWARDTHNLGRMDVLHILEVEGFDEVPDLVKAKDRIMVYMVNNPGGPA